jgi:dTDP-4-amino-4,6-dideoxygalactose transaminase
VIDLFRPFVPKEARDAVDEVLRSRYIGQGPRVDQFERAFEKRFGISPKNAVSLNSGTAALETAYDILGLKAGDEVISTPLTCTATNIPLIRRGVKIVWADILPDTLCIDPIDVHAKITKKTKAVVQVHLGGLKADVGHLHVPVISDAAQALGIFNGDFTCCSFQAIKHLTTGDGGMFVVHSKDRNNERDRNNVKLLRWFGIDRERKLRNNWQAYTERQMTFDIQIPGHKRQMTDIAAAMGLVGLQKYDWMMATRGQQFQIYQQRLAGIDGIQLIDGEENKHWLATVLVERRDDFAKAMFEADIDTNLVQLRNDIFKLFGGTRAELPVMNDVEGKYISIPLGPHLSDDDINFVCDKIQEGW